MERSYSISYKLAALFCALCMLVTNITFIVLFYKLQLFIYSVKFKNTVIAVFLRILYYCHFIYFYVCIHTLHILLLFKYFFSPE